MSERRLRVVWRLNARPRSSLPDVKRGLFRALDWESLKPIHLPRRVRQNSSPLRVPYRMPKWMTVVPKSVGEHKVFEREDGQLFLLVKPTVGLSNRPLMVHARSAHAAALKLATRLRWGAPLPAPEAAREIVLATQVRSPDGSRHGWRFHQFVVKSEPWPGSGSGSGSRRANSNRRRARPPWPRQPGAKPPPFVPKTKPRAQILIRNDVERHPLANAVNTFRKRRPSLRRRPLRPEFKQVDDSANLTDLKADLTDVKSDLREDLTDLTDRKDRESNRRPVGDVDMKHGPPADPEHFGSFDGNYHHHHSDGDGDGDGKDEKGDVDHLPLLGDVDGNRDDGEVEDGKGDRSVWGSLCGTGTDPTTGLSWDQTMDEADVVSILVRTHRPRHTTTRVCYLRDDLIQAMTKGQRYARWVPDKRFPPPVGQLDKRVRYYLHGAFPGWMNAAGLAALRNAHDTVFLVQPAGKDRVGMPHRESPMEVTPGSPSPVFTLTPLVSREQALAHQGHIDHLTARHRNPKRPALQDLGPRQVAKVRKHIRYPLRADQQHPHGLRSGV